MGRILAVGDIHGCALTLESLIDQIELMHDDQIVFLGDYVDRGNGVYETVERLIKLKEEYGDVVTFLMGNHEEMFIRYLKGECRMNEDRMFLYNGGGVTIRSYRENLGITGKQDEFARPEYELYWNNLPQRHKDFYDSLKVCHEIDQYVFVHAGVRPDVKLGDQLAHDMIWIRDEFLYHEQPVMEGKIIVHGHTPMEKYEIQAYNEHYDDKYNLDSACVFGRDLTCLDLTNMVYHRVPCRDKRIG